MRSVENFVSLFYVSIQRSVQCLRRFSPLFRRFLSYIFRVCAFQLGLYETGLLARVIVRMIKRHFDIPYKDLVLTSEGLDDFIFILEDLGGERCMKPSIDGEAVIDYMILNVENVKRRIEQKGGRWTEIAVRAPERPSVYEAANSKNSHYLQAIFAEEDSPEWTAFFEQTLNRFGWEKATICFSDSKRPAWVTLQTPFKPTFSAKGCFLRCHSPGRSYGMDQIYIGRHLSLQKDLCLFNYRGTHCSQGVPSEGGYYLDAETLFHELIATHSYQPEQIWVSGFSLGGAVAAYLKAKYHDRGINYVGENTFDSFEKLIDHLIWPANSLGKWVICSILSTTPSIRGRVKEDFFNTISKFNSLKPTSKQSVSVIIDTKHDPILPNGSAQMLHKTLQQIGPAYLISHTSNGFSNPHGDDLYDDEQLWKKYSSIFL